MKTLLIWDEWGVIRSTSYYVIDDPPEWLVECQDRPVIMGEEHKHRHELLDRLKALLKNEWEDKELELFGVVLLDMGGPFQIVRCCYSTNEVGA